MKANKFDEIAARVISYVGYFLLTAFMVIFGIMTILAVASVFIEKDIFNLIGVAGAGFVTWCIWSLRKEMLL